MPPSPPPSPLSTPQNVPSHHPHRPTPKFPPSPSTLPADTPLADPLPKPEGTIGVFGRTLPPSHSPPLSPFSTTGGERVSRGGQKRGGRICSSPEPSERSELRTTPNARAQPKMQKKHTHTHTQIAQVEGLTRGSQKNKRNSHPHPDPPKYAHTTIRGEQRTANDKTLCQFEFSLGNVARCAQSSLSPSPLSRSIRKLSVDC